MILNDSTALEQVLAGLRKIRNMEDISGEEFDSSMDAAIGIIEEMLIPPYDDQPSTKPRPEDDPDFDGYPGRGGFY